MTTRIRRDPGRSAATARIAADYDDAVDAYSIPTFCRRHGISEAFYHKIKVKGLGPATLRIGRRILITAEAAAAWRRARESNSKTA